MRTGRPIPPLKITAPEREALEQWAQGHDPRLAARASAILASADGVSNKNVASRCAMTKQTVGKWRARFRTHRLQGLHDEPRPGAPRRITDEQVATVIRLTGERAPNGAAWTTRSMAQALGLTQTAISRIWRTHGVRPVTGNDAGDGDGRAVAARPRPLSPASPDLEVDTRARARTLAAIHNLLRDARALRGSCSAELDPLLALAVDAIERALEKHHERGRSSVTRAETALRNARNLLDQAQAAARNVEQLDVPGPRRCPSCGSPYTLRFTVRGVGGDMVTAHMPCPRSRCGKPVQVQVPKTAERVRLEEATS